MTTPDPGRKLPPQFENPFDNIFLIIANKLNPFFHSAGLTANHITILSGICALYCVIFFAFESYALSALFYLIAYYFDVMDGYYARTYKMVSKWGDTLDHAKDIIMFVLLYVVIIITPKISLAWKLWFIFIAVFFSIILFIYLGCQEVYYKKIKGITHTDESPSISSLKMLCYKDREEETLRKLRWLGTGSYAVVVSISILLLSLPKFN